MLQLIQKDATTVQKVNNLNFVIANKPLAVAIKTAVRRHEHDQTKTDENIKRAEKCIEKLHASRLSEQQRRVVYKYAAIQDAIYTYYTNDAKDFLSFVPRSYTDHLVDRESCLLFAIAMLIGSSCFSSYEIWDMVVYLRNPRKSLQQLIATFNTSRAVELGSDHPFLVEFIEELNAFVWYGLVKVINFKAQ